MRCISQLLIPWVKWICFNSNGTQSWRFLNTPSSFWFSNPCLCNCSNNFIKFEFNYGSDLVINFTRLTRYLHIWVKNHTCWYFHLLLLAIVCLYFNTSCTCDFIHIITHSYIKRKENDRKKKVSTLTILLAVDPKLF